MAKERRQCLFRGSPPYSLVSGSLPIADVGNNQNVSLAKFEIDVSAAGEIGIRIANPQGLQIIAGENAKITPAEPELKVTYETGRHEIILVVDRPSRSSGDLSVELFDVRGSSGRAAASSGP